MFAKPLRSGSSPVQVVHAVVLRSVQGTVSLFLSPSLSLSHTNTRMSGTFLPGQGKIGFKFGREKPCREKSTRMCRDRGSQLRKGVERERALEEDRRPNSESGSGEKGLSCKSARRARATSAQPSVSRSPARGECRRQDLHAKSLWQGRTLFRIQIGRYRDRAGASCLCPPLLSVHPSIHHFITLAVYCSRHQRHSVTLRTRNWLSACFPRLDLAASIELCFHHRTYPFLSFSFPLSSPHTICLPLRGPTRTPTVGSLVLCRPFL